MIFLKDFSRASYCICTQFSSVAQSCPTLRSNELQYTRLSCPSPTPRACSNSFPLTQWCHPTTSSSVILFYSCFQGLFQCVDSSHRVVKVLEPSFSIRLLMNIQDWFPLGLTGLISFQSKRLLGVLSNTTVQKHQFFGAQPFCSKSHNHTWIWKKS